MAPRRAIIRRLRSLEDIDDVSVDVSEGEKTVSVRHNRERSLDFKFRWLNEDHFAGYFMDSDGKQSQAVLSLWTPMDAVYFATCYALLVGIRAGRPSPS